MIKAVECTNESGESIRLTLAEPESSGFVIESITGLGPEGASISTADNNSGDGVEITGKRVSSKNIVLNLIFYWKDGMTIEDIRHLSYKMFPVKETVKLVIVTDNRTLKIEGTVETNEPDIFNSQEGCSISIICPEPYFRSNSSKETVLTGLEKAFTFPFSNNSTDTPLLVFGRRKNSKSKVIVYNGEEPRGVQIVMDFIGHVGDIDIYHNNSQEHFGIKTNKIQIGNVTGILYGDQIILSTIKRKKKLVLIRNGKEYNILKTINKNVTWFELIKGNNLFSYSVASGSENMEFKVLTETIYKGV